MDALPFSQKTKRIISAIFYLLSAGYWVFDFWRKEFLPEGDFDKYRLGVIIPGLSNDFNWWVFIGLISFATILIIPEIFSLFKAKNNKQNGSLWAIEKEKEPEKIIFSVDVHKSPNWEKDNQFLLCIHNESFFRDVKNISVLITGINKIENGKSEFALNRSVILHEKLNIPKMKASVDFSFLEIAKKENKFIIRAIHQETPDKEVFEHDFGYGEYVINIVLKRKDIGRDSIVIPIHIKYDGWNKISGEIHKMFPRNLFPMSL